MNSNLNTPKSFNAVNPFLVMQILYVGPLFPGSTALHRMHALRQLGCSVTAIDTDLSVPSVPNKYRRVVKGLRTRTDQLIDWLGVHHKIIRAVKKSMWDVLWVDKGVRLKPSVLKEIKRLQPGCRLVSYSPDDMFNPANQTDRYRAAFGIYDLFVTTKSYNVNEFLSAGAKDVIWVGNAYEPSVHREIPLTDEERKKWGCDVCFVGACERERERSIEFLAEAGVSLGLFGRWGHIAQRYPNVQCHEGFFADDAYVKALRAGKIGLGFLRKVNRDLQTQRSVELPACGVFMLAERTDEHLALFKEGEEADFFSSDEELKEKVHYYLQNDDIREKIAAAGRMRCINDGYSNAERLRIVLDHLSLT